MTRELSRHFWRPALLPAFGLILGACSEATHPVSAQDCDPGNGGLTLPDGFCASVVVDSLGPARHLAVAPNGDIFVALRNSFGPGRTPLPGGVVV
ncbi:MAG: hypothetical protein PVJ04_02885, partial [Gemmatimonadota bacterium]